MTQQNYKIKIRNTNVIKHLCHMILKFTLSKNFISHLFFQFYLRYLSKWWTTSFMCLGTCLKCSTGPTSGAADLETIMSIVKDLYVKTVEINPKT